MDTYLAQMLVIIGILIATFYKDLVNEKFKWLYIFIIFVLGCVLAFVTYNINQKAITEKNLANQKYDSLQKIEFNYLGIGNTQPTFVFSQYNPSTFYSLILNNDSFPLKDIRITIKDEDKFQEVKNNFKTISTDSAINNRDRMFYTSQHYSEYAKDIYFPYLNANDNIELPNIDVTSKIHLNYRVDLNWSNGWITYYIECNKTNSGWIEKRKEYDRKTKITVIN